MVSRTPTRPCGAQVLKIHRLTEPSRLTHCASQPDTETALLPSAADAAANVPPAVEAAFQRLDDRRSEAEMRNEAFTPAEVQQALQ